MDTNRRRFLSGLTSLLSWAALAPAAMGRSYQGARPDSGASDATWKLIDGVVYGARPDSKGPIGGSVGYESIITKGEYEVHSVDELIAALAAAKPGEVVFIPGGVEIDLTARIYIESLVLTIPAGVTLAGDRGKNGSEGALITSDALKTPVMFKAGGASVRISGLRIQGPNPKRYTEHHIRSFGSEGLGRAYYYKFPVSTCIQTDVGRLEVDNCELSAFSKAVSLLGGSGHHIHHNYIHHCQYRGLGYGITHRKAQSLIEYNLFNYNRHSIAGTGMAGCSYIARHNVNRGVSLSHCFDMHGGRDRNDGTEVAGTYIEIYNNTFLPSERAVGIRGVPELYCKVYHNWIWQHTKPETAVMREEKTLVYENLYGQYATVPK